MSSSLNITLTYIILCLFSLSFFLLLALPADVSVHPVFLCYIGDKNETSPFVQSGRDKNLALYEVGITISMGNYIFNKYLINI